MHRTQKSSILMLTIVLPQKDRNQNQPMYPNGRPIQHYLGASQTWRFLCPHPVESACVTPEAHRCVTVHRLLHSREAHLSTYVHSFYLDLFPWFDWLSYWPCDPNSSPPPSCRGWSDIKMARNPKPLIIWLVFPAWPAGILNLFLSINYLVKITSQGPIIWKIPRM